MSGNRFEIGFNLTCVLPTDRAVGLVYLCTQLFLFQKHLQDKPTDRAIILIAAIVVTLVKTFSFSPRTRNHGGIPKFC